MMVPSKTNATMIIIFGSRRLLVGIAPKAVRMMLAAVSTTPVAKATLFFMGKYSNPECCTTIWRGFALRKVGQ